MTLKFVSGKRVRHSSKALWNYRVLKLGPNPEGFARIPNGFLHSPISYDNISHIDKLTDLLSSDNELVVSAS